MPPYLKFILSFSSDDLLATEESSQVLGLTSNVMLLKDFDVLHAYKSVIES